MNQTVCKFTPMFICNPFENPDGSMSYGQATEALFTAIGDLAMRRRLIQMRQGGGGGSYTPGNYGFLVSPSIGNGASALRDAIAMVNPPACFGQSGVETETGFIASVRAAFNVRFDVYEGSMNGVRNDPNFRPAMNTRKGMVLYWWQRVQRHTKSRHSEFPAIAARYLL